MKIIFQNALLLYKKNMLDEATQLFKQILEINPTHADSLYFLGIIAMDKRAFDVALTFLDKACLLNPQNQNYIFSLAVALQETGHFQEALSYFKQISHLPETQNCIGNIYRAQGLSSKAIKAFDTALEQNPEMVLAMINKASLLSELGKNQEALHLLEKAVQTDNTFPSAWYHLGIQQQKTGLIDQSLVSLEKALNLNQNISAFWNTYGQSLSLKGRNEDALVAFDKALRLDHFLYDAYFNKALILERIGQFDEAETAYRNAIRGNRHFANAYNNLGALLYKTGRIYEALETYRQVFIINPKHMEACFNLAVALEDLEEYEEAAGLYFNILSQKAFSNQVHIRLASLLPKWFSKNNKDSKEVLRFAQGWYKNFPDNPLARHTFHVLSGHYEDNTLFSYIQTIYNAFADSYDDKMKELNCCVPNLIHSLLPSQTKLNILDLGCGTGACGTFLKPLSKKLVGVDISAQMLQHAEKTACYDILKQMDILDFLTHTKTKYNLIVAADVFCYIGDLSEIFKQTYEHLEKGGLFLFTIESNNTKENYRITPFSRFLHKKEYIENLLKEIGLSWTLQEVSLRKEGTGWANGYLIRAQK